MLIVDIGKSLAFEFNDGMLEQLERHENVKAHVWYIGLRNILMDSHASCKREDYESDLDWREKSKAMAEKKLVAMIAGEIRANTSGPRISKADPIQAEALRLARVVVYSAAKAKGQTDKEIILKAILSYAARNDVVALAKSNVEAKNSLVVDDDLGL